MAIPDISTMTEDEGRELFWRMREQFGWAGTVQTMADINVHIEAPDRYVDLDWEDGEEEDLTPAMRRAVQDTYVWSTRIGDQMAEVGNELMPYVVLYLDGSFGVVAPGEDEKRYNADGTRSD